MRSKNLFKKDYSTSKKRSNIKKNEKSVIKQFNCIKICNKKWVEVNDLSSGQYSVNKNIRFKTSLLRSNICDYIDAYFVVKRATTLEGYDDDKKRNEK